MIVSGLDNNSRRSRPSRAATQDACWSTCDMAEGKTSFFRIAHPTKMNCISFTSLRIGRGLRNKFSSVGRLFERECNLEAENLSVKSSHHQSPGLRCIPYPYPSPAQFPKTLSYYHSIVTRRMHMLMEFPVHKDLITITIILGVGHLQFSILVRGLELQDNSTSLPSADDGLSMVLWPGSKT